MIVIKEEISLQDCCLEELPLCDILKHNQGPCL